jgi:hypothetical protein
MPINVGKVEFPSAFNFEMILAGLNPLGSAGIGVIPEEGC